MINFIICELSNLLCSGFQGHVRFGVEKSNVVALSMNSKCNSSNQAISLKDIENQIGELKTEYSPYFGAFEFDICNGEITQFDWFYSCNGQDLRSKINAVMSDLPKRN